MLRTDYERIFLGSSCFALGCAARQPKDTLIIESGEGFGGEFVDALRADGRPIIRPQGEGAAFYEELKMRGILDDESAAQRGGLYPPQCRPQGAASLYTGASLRAGYDDRVWRAYCKPAQSGQKDGGQSVR